MAIIKYPQRNLLVAALKIWERRWVFFKYKDTVPPVEPAVVVSQATPTAGRPGTPWE